MINRQLKEQVIWYWCTNNYKDGEQMYVILCALHVASLQPPMHECVCINTSLRNIYVSSVDLTHHCIRNSHWCIWHTRVVIGPKGNQLYSGCTLMSPLHWPIYTYISCHWKINKQQNFPRWSFKDGLSLKSLILCPFINNNSSKLSLLCYHLTFEFNSDDNEKFR